jgi:hypothetical protein
MPPPILPICIAPSPLLFCVGINRAINRCSHFGISPTPYLRRFAGTLPILPIWIAPSPVLCWLWVPPTRPEGAAPSKAPSAALRTSFEASLK